MHASIPANPRSFRRGALLALALAAACQPEPSAPDASASASAKAPLATKAFDELDLGFEQGTAPRGWELERSDYPATLDDTQAFEGKRSLALAHDGIHTKGRVRLPLPIEAVRGHGLHARVHVRTKGVSRGGVGLMLTAERGVDTIARRQTPEPAKLRGDADWIAIELAVDIPADAEEAHLVLEHAGNGTAWFDGIELQLTETSAPPPPARVEGSVRDEAGKPVGGAMVVLFSMDGESSAFTTDAEGQFSLESAAGPHMVGVGGEAGVASTMVELAAGTNPALALQVARGSQTIRGILRDQNGAPFGGALAMAMTPEELAYPTRTDAEGRFTLVVPPSPEYMIAFMGPTGQRVMEPLKDPKAEVSAVMPREGGVPTAAIEWIGQRHVPLRTAAPEQGIDDLAGLDPTFAAATVVGLGEATHGTREFFQLKHRMLEYLVERHGFTIFGIEASRSECRAIDRYVQTGEGDPKAAIKGIYFWTWDTEEVLALVEWMRQYNAAHPGKLGFVGFDMQTPTVAAGNALAYLDQVDPEASEREALTMFSRPWHAEAYAELDPAARTETTAALDRLIARFDERRSTFTAATSADAFADAQEDLVQVRQVVSVLDAGADAFAARDRAMADNVLHIAHRYGEGTKAVLWAHNGHVTRTRSQVDVMGKHLAQALGDRYVSVGFTFDHGGFQALGLDGEATTGLREHRVGPAGKDDLEAALREVGPAVYALPLRELPKEGPAAEWLRSPRSMRHIGAVFAGDDLTSRVIEPVTDRFDVLVFVEETSRARPIRRD
jgi:erythromycin esterase